MAYAQMDGKIYVFGGLDKYDDGDADDSTMIYDIDSVGAQTGVRSWWHS